MAKIDIESGWVQIDEPGDGGPVWVPAIVAKYKVKSWHFVDKASGITAGTGKHDIEVEVDEEDEDKIKKDKDFKVKTIGIAP